MITLSGQRLVATILVDSSPAAHPLRTLFFSFPIVLFTYYSLHFLRHVSSGATIVYHPRNFLRTLSVIPGRHSLTSTQKKQRFIRSYNGPLASAFLGLLLFAAAEILLIMLFREAHYTFIPL